MFHNLCLVYSGIENCWSSGVPPAVVRGWQTQVRIPTLMHATVIIQLKKIPPICSKNCTKIAEQMREVCKQVVKHFYTYVEK